MSNFLQDVRFGLKMLGKSPSFTLIAILTLALGIGVNAAVFTVVNDVLLQPLPFANPDRLVVLWTRFEAMGLSEFWFSGPELLDLQRQVKGLDRTAAVTSGNENLTGSGEPEQIRAAFASARFFPLLGVKAAHGRLFLPEEDIANSRKVVVLQHEYWRSRFGGDAGLVGKNLILDDEPYLVIGVLPPRFDFPAPDEKFGKVQVWHPLATDMAKENRGEHWLRVIGRLKSGVGIEQVAAELSGVASRLEQEYPTNYRSTGWGLRIVPLHDQVVRGVRTEMLVLVGAVAFVLLIACVNVANLLLARATARGREVSIRKALGASQLRLVRQLLTESLLLALLGGAFGALLAYWSVNLFVALSSDLPLVGEVAVDVPTFLFTFGLSLFVGVLFGLAPALLASATALGEAMKSSDRGGSGSARGRLLQDGFAVAEIAFAFVLLVGAALLGQSFLRMQRADLGFSSTNLLTMRLTLPRSKYPEDPQQAAFFTRFLSQLESIPGVTSAGAVSRLPLSNTRESGTIDLETKDNPDGHLSIDVDTRPITPNYFKTLGISMIKGRSFNPLDTEVSQRVAIVDEKLAARAWPHSDPIGHRLRLSDKDWKTVVGVVEHVKHDGPSQEGREQVYFPMLQEPNRSMFLALRPSGSIQAASLIPGVRAELKKLDSDQPIADLKVMQEWIDQAFSKSRFSALLIGFLAVTALLLAIIGIYGVISYGVSQRRRELGVRMALGATGSNVVRLVFHRGFKLALLGVGIGAVAALVLTRSLSGLLYGVKAEDPLTFVGIAVLLALIALAACGIPARRATRIDPMVAFRYE